MMGDWFGFQRATARVRKGTQGNLFWWTWLDVFEQLFEVVGALIFFERIFVICNSPKQLEIKRKFLKFLSKF